MDADLFGIRKVTVKSLLCCRSATVCVITLHSLTIKLDHSNALTLHLWPFCRKCLLSTPPTGMEEGAGWILGIVIVRNFWEP